MSHIISILNQKGGVGKTTTAVTLSACLAERGYKTLLIDADPQCNASLSIRYEGKDKDATLLNLLLNMEEALDYDQIVKHTIYPNLDIIPSNDVLYALDLTLAQIDNKEFILKNRLAPLAKIYDFIIMDGPPNLGVLSVNLMTASSSIIVPLKADYLSLQGLAILLSSYKQMKSYLNPGLYICGILLTMHSTSLNLCKEVEQDLKNNLKELVFATYIPQNIKIAESPSHRIPIIYHDPKCIGSIKYKEFTDELISKLKVKKG